MRFCKLDTQIEPGYSLFYGASKILGAILVGIVLYVIAAHPLIQFSNDAVTGFTNLTEGWRYDSESSSFVSEMYTQSSLPQNHVQENIGDISGVVSI